MLYCRPATSLREDLSQLAVSRSAVRSARIRHRSESAHHIRTLVAESENVTTLLFHWDGKMLPALTGKEMMDRLPILVSDRDSPRDGETCQLLGAPQIPAGTGMAQTDAVVVHLEDWNVRHRVVGMVFDTTAANTGRFGETCL